MFIKSFTFHLFEYLITIISKKFFNGIFFFCSFVFSFSYLKYGVAPSNMESQWTAAFVM